MSLPIEIFYANKNIKGKMCIFSHGTIEYKLIL